MTNQQLHQTFKAAGKVLREEIVEDLGEEYFEVETYGELKYMPQGAQSVRAIFGNFTRTENSTLLYQCYITRDGESEKELMSIYDSQYLDDLECLKTGRVERES